MKTRIENLSMIGFIILVFVLMTACGGGGGSDGGSIQEPATDLTGTWNVQETQNGNCEGSTYPQYETYTATVSQVGNDFNITFTLDNEPHTISGIISGSTLTWRETRTDDDSTTSIEFSGRVSGDGNTINGTAEWKWTDGSYTCTGTTEATATRVVESSFDVTGTWEGTWQSSDHGVSGTFTAIIIQQGSTLSGSIEVSEIGMYDAELKGTTTGETIVFGDIEDHITFTGTVSEGLTSSGTYVYPSLNDDGAWQGTKEVVSGNNKPIAHNLSVSATEDTPVDIALSASDLDGDELTWHIDSQPAYGTLSGTAPALTYTPDTGCTGSDSFTFHVNDSSEDSNIATVNITVTSTVNWHKSDMGFAFAEQGHLVIGDGRNNGDMRVYSGDASGGTGNIYEFSFVSNQWQKVSFSEIETQYGTDDLCTIKGIDIGTGRNDGVNRVYVSGYNMAEFYYDSNSWPPGTKIGGDTQWTNDLALGDARNDGRIRVYVAKWDSILELTHNDGGWHILEIDTAGAGIKKLLITDGRNDGTLRIYAAQTMGDHVYEYTWSGSTWQVDDCGASGAISFYDMVAGDGRNDGTNRIYMAANWGGIYELSYDGDSWQYTVIANPAPLGYVSTVAVGDGRHDGVNRVYAWYSPSISEGYLAEYTFSAFSGSWLQSDIDSDVGINDIAIGNGRNDGINCVYVTADDSHIYEYREKDGVSP